MKLTIENPTTWNAVPRNEYALDNPFVGDAELCAACREDQVIIWNGFHWVHAATQAQACPKGRAS